MPVGTALNHYVRLGGTGLRVSPLCLGTMTWGDTWAIGGTKEESREIFMEYCKAGGNFIDTANKYHEGQSETWLGEFMEEANNRDDLIVATKFSLAMKTEATIKPPSGKEGGGGAGWDGKEGDDGTTDFVPSFVGNTRKNMHVSVARSLKRLKTDYIDILYVHYWDYSADSEEVMRALNDLVSAGKVLYLGISDAPAWAVAECNAIAKLRGWTPFSVAQYQYSLVSRTIEANVLNYCLNRPNVAMVNWAVLGGGKLTGKYKPGEEAKDAEDTKRGASGWMSLNDKDHKIIEAVLDVAKEVEREPAQVAIAWARQRPGVTSPLIGCRTLRQYKSNVGALDLRLSDEHMERLNEASKFDLPFPENFCGIDFDSNKFHTAFGHIKVTDKGN